MAWRDLIRGMRNRAGYIMNDPSDGHDRNGNWYARKVYGYKYETIRKEFQDEMMDDINQNS